jgi:hypothetical protein
MKTTVTGTTGYEMPAAILIGWRSIGAGFHCRAGESLGVEDGIAQLTAR